MSVEVERASAHGVGDEARPRNVCPPRLLTRRRAIVRVTDAGPDSIGGR